MKDLTEFVFRRKNAFFIKNPNIRDNRTYSPDEIFVEGEPFTFSYGGITYTGVVDQMDESKLSSEIIVLTD
jgi:hypothetical protein